MYQVGARFLMRARESVMQKRYPHAIRAAIIGNTPVFRRRATVILAIGLNERMSPTRYRYSCTKIYRWSVVGALPLSLNYGMKHARKMRASVTPKRGLGAGPSPARRRYPLLR